MVSDLMELQNTTDSTTTTKSKVITIITLHHYITDSSAKNMSIYAVFISYSSATV